MCVCVCGGGVTFLKNHRINQFLTSFESFSYEQYGHQKEPWYHVLLIKSLSSNFLDFGGQMSNLTNVVIVAVVVDLRIPKRNETPFAR